jgi:hypothetical protein
VSPLSSDQGKQTEEESGDEFGKHGGKDAGIWEIKRRYGDLLLKCNAGYMETCLVLWLVFWIRERGKIKSSS